LPVVLAALALALIVGTQGLSGEKEKKMEGKLTKVEANKITMVDKDGKNEHSHKVAADAKITCEGKECKLADLQAGFLVTVVTKGDNAIRIDARKKEE